MADIKTKGSLEKPKVKTSGVVLKEATSIIKEKYQEQQERNAPGQKDPVRYATDKVESGGKRAARTAGDALKQKAKKSLPSSAARKQLRIIRTPQSRRRPGIPKPQTALGKRRNRLLGLPHSPHRIRIQTIPAAMEGQTLTHNTINATCPQLPPNFPQLIVLMQIAKRKMLEEGHKNWAAKRPSRTLRSQRQKGRSSANSAPEIRPNS